MSINRWLATAGLAAGLCLGTSQAFAQQDNNQGGQGGPGGGRFGRGNFDPAQMRQRMMERMKDQLEVTDDAEWKSLEPLISKVMDARMAGLGGGMRGMFGRNRGGDNGGDQGQRRFGPPPSPEAEALQRAIDGKASNSELKAAITKYVEYRKTKQAELEKAQAELRKVLTLRQEAILTSDGLL